ncbi:MAG TPA: ester cyclase [Gammaproteobacteria bacterium]|nr:ester cyclase [Gammaproteobacteria bacterium]
MRALCNRRLASLGAALLAVATLAGCGRGAVDADKQRATDSLRTFLIERDWQRWPDYFAPNATLNDTDLALQIMRGTADGLNFSFADLKLTIREQVAEPQRVATVFVLEGRHERPFNDQPPTHQRLEIDGFAFDRFENGKIVESRLFLDVWGLSGRAAAAAASPPK